MSPASTQDMHEAEHNNTCVVIIHPAPAPHPPSARLITASLLVYRPRAAVFRVLTAYDRLSDYLPNCTHSQVLPLPPGSQATVRITQTAVETLPFWKGQQQQGGRKTPSSSSSRFLSSLSALNPISLLTQATVLLDVYEDPVNHTITSYLVENSSAFLRTYEGRWRLFREEEEGGRVGTRMCYEALVRPREVIPIMAVEWKMRRDIATNLAALKRVAEEEGGGNEEEEEEGEEEEDVFWDCLEEQEEEGEEGREEERVGESLDSTTSTCSSSFSLFSRQELQQEEEQQQQQQQQQQQRQGRRIISSSFFSFRRVAVSLPRFGGQGKGQGQGGWMARRRRKIALTDAEASQ